MIKYALMIIALVLLGGCASMTPTYDKSGRLTNIKVDYKVLTDVTYESKIIRFQDGSVKEEYVKYETKTNVDRVLGALNGLVGTMSGVTRDLMP